MIEAEWVMLGVHGVLAPSCVGRMSREERPDFQIQHVALAVRLILVGAGSASPVSGIAVLVLCFVDLFTQYQG